MNQYSSNVPQNQASVNQQQPQQQQVAVNQQQFQQNQDPFNLGMAQAAQQPPAQNQPGGWQNQQQQQQQQQQPPNQQQQLQQADQQQQHAQQQQQQNQQSQQDQKIQQQPMVQQPMMQQPQQQMMYQQNVQPQEQMQQNQQWPQQQQPQQPYQSAWQLQQNQDPFSQGYLSNLQNPVPLQQASVPGMSCQPVPSPFGNEPAQSGHLQQMMGQPYPQNPGIQQPYYPLPQQQPMPVQNINNDDGWQPLGYPQPQHQIHGGMRQQNQQRFGYFGANRCTSQDRSPMSGSHSARIMERERQIQKEQARSLMKSLALKNEQKFLGTTPEEIIDYIYNKHGVLGQVQDVYYVRKWIRSQKSTMRDSFDSFGYGGSDFGRYR